MEPEILSVTPQRLRCYSCGTYGEDGAQWTYRLRLQGHSAVCPSCRMSVEREIEEQGRDPNVGLALLLGGLAALVGSATWFGIAAATDHTFGVVAIAIGWVVGKAVVRGSGNKRGFSLQALATALTVCAIVGGEYLIVNRVARTLVAASPRFSGWLSPGQFIDMYMQLMGAKGVLFDLAFILIAIASAFLLPRSDRLVSESLQKVAR